MHPFFVKVWCNILLLSDILAYECEWVFFIILETTGNSKMGLKLFRSLLERFLNSGFSFTVLHWSGNKDCFIDKLTRWHSGNAKTSASSFKNFKYILSILGTVDVSWQAKIFLMISNIALYSSKLWQLLSLLM